jgi:hypothetical protein
MKTQDLLIEAADKDHMSVETYIEKLLILCLDSSHDFSKWQEKQMSVKQLLNGRPPTVITNNEVRTLSVEEEFHKIESIFSMN